MVRVEVGYCEGYVVFVEDLCSCVSDSSSSYDLCFVEGDVVSNFVWVGEVVEYWGWVVDEEVDWGVNFCFFFYCLEDIEFF